MTIFFNNLKRIFGKKKNLIFMVVVPILINVIIISLYVQDTSYTVGILDYDKTELTEKLISYLEESSEFKYLTKEDNLNEMVFNGKVDCIFQFDDGFTKQILEGKNASVKCYGVEDSAQIIPIKNNMDSAISVARQAAAATKGEESAFYKAMEQYEKRDYIAEYHGIGNNKNDDVEQAALALGYIALGMAFLISYSTLLIIEDKDSGIYDRLIVSPQKMSMYYFQHLLSSIVVAVIQTVVLMIVLPVIVHISFGDNILQIVSVGAICVLFAMCFIAIGLVIAGYARNKYEANAWVIMFNIPVLMLGGCMWPRSLMPEIFQRIGDFMPTAWFLSAAEHVLYGDGLRKTLQPVLYMCVFIIVLMVFAFAKKARKDE